MLNKSDFNFELTIVMPCLNEAETIVSCIKKANLFFNKHSILGEVVVADNGSIDNSKILAIKHGARVVEVHSIGYGSAIRGGIESANSEFVIVGDSDDSHDFENLELFYQGLTNGYDLIIGNRFKGGLYKDDMPFLHRYLGNPILTGLGNLFFGTNIGDFHCGLRALNKTSYFKMNLTTNGMEFASEMIVKAKLHSLNMIEVPTKVFPSGRSREAHLKTWPDGWRHLRFLLLYSPKWLFFYPGFILILTGVILSLNFINRFIQIDQNILFCAAAILILTGFQFVLFYALTKIFATNNGLIPQTKNYQSIFTKLTLERGLVLGLSSIVFGVGYFVYNFDTLKIVNEKYYYMYVTLVAICLGLQTVLFSFFFSILGLKNKQK
jgi:glycosyltransferase involved in cell wall biosynthesis